MTSAELLAAHARCMPHTQRLHLGAPPPGLVTVAASDLLDEGRLRDVLATYAAQLRADDLRAAASVWSKHHCGAFVPGVVALMTLEDIGIDARAANVRLAFDGGCAREAWIPATLAERGASRAELRAATLRPLLDGHLALLFEAVERVSGCPRVVLWSNVGNSLAWHLDRFETAAPEAAREARKALLVDEASPMRDPVTYEDLAPHGVDRRVQVRRTCCLRHRLPGTTMCYTCPRLSAPERATLVARLEAPS